MSELKIFSAFVMVFLVSFVFGAMTEKAFSPDTTANSFTGLVINEPQSKETPKENIFVREKPSPQDWLSEDDIRVYSDRVILDIDNPQWARFTDTNSMDPLFDEDSNAIEIVPQTPEQIEAGDTGACYKDVSYSWVSRRDKRRGGSVGQIYI